MATQKPCDQWPCDSGSEEERTQNSTKQRAETGESFCLSVPISPGSRLYERAFSNEIKQCSVSSHAVLQCGGAVLGNGNEALNHQSSEDFDGEKWDFFISHNWSVKRWKKFLALCLVWSGRRALICCICVQLLCFTLVSLGFLPLSSNQTDSHQISIWCIGGCLVTFAAVFLAMHEVLRFLGLPGYRTFLDKVCVDQSDEDRKREGIQGITAFLYHSEALVVLYSELYLQRLWTVFELTTFIALKPEGRIVVQPVILGPVAGYFVIIQALRIPELFLVPLSWQNLRAIDLASAIGSIVIISVDLLSLFFGAVLLRMWGRIRSRMTQQIESFSFDHAECHIEADRIEILGAIKALARKEGLVPADAPTKLCTKSFELLVQTTVPKRVSGAFRSTGIPCEVACLMALPSMALVLDLSAVRLRNLQDGGVLDVVAEILLDATFEACMPIFIGLAGILSGIRRGNGLFEAACTLGCFGLLVLGIWLPGACSMYNFAANIPASPAVRCLLLGLLLLAQFLALFLLYFNPNSSCMLNLRHCSCLRRAPRPA